MGLHPLSKLRVQARTCDSLRMNNATCAQPAGAAGAGHNAQPAGFINEETFLARVPICRRTAKTWRDSGQLPFIKLGKRILYHWATVEQALLRKQRGGQ